MSPKVFMTGVTGYIAGDAFYALSRAHPELEYSALVRSADKAEIVKAKYPAVRIVLGGLDDSDILEREAREADVVIHAADASDHEAAARAISRGLLAGHSKKKPGYWLHTSGAGILTYLDSFANKLGEHSDKQFDDWEHVAEMTSLPDEAFHRNVDKVVLETDPQREKGVDTAIVCPPTIYGRGRGPVSQRGRPFYELAQWILQNQKVPILGQGKARWNNIHVADLSDVFVKLVDVAINGTTAGQPESEIWGAKGYFFAENGEHEWGALTHQIGAKAGELGWIPARYEEARLDKEQAIQAAGFEALLWGLNSRGNAYRARNVLGWRPSRNSVEEEVENFLREEKERLETS